MLQDNEFMFAQSIGSHANVFDEALFNSSSKNASLAPSVYARWCLQLLEGIASSVSIRPSKSPAEPDIVGFICSYWSMIQKSRQAALLRKGFCSIFMHRGNACSYQGGLCQLWKLWWTRRGRKAEMLRIICRDALPFHFTRPQILPGSVCQQNRPVLTQPMSLEHSTMTIKSFIFFSAVSVLPLRR